MNFILIEKNENYYDDEKRIFSIYWNEKKSYISDVTAVVGINGAGKSTLVSEILLCDANVNINENKIAKGQQNSLCQLKENINFLFSNYIFCIKMLLYLVRIGRIVCHG